MRYLKFIFILSIAFFLASCTENTPIDEKVIDSFIETIPYEINSDLDLQTTYIYNKVEYNVVYFIKDKDTITDEGKVFRGFKEINTTIEVRIIKGDKFIEKDVDLLIVPYSKEEIKQLILTNLQMDTHITKDLNLPKVFKYENLEANLIWTSSNQNIITNEGKVNFAVAKQKVNLSLKFEYNTIIHTYNDLFLLEIEGVSEEEILEFTANNLTVSSSTNKNIYMPTEINGVTLFWSSSNPKLISSTGVFTYPDEDTVVKLSVTFFYKGKTITRTYQITLLAMPNEERIDLAISSISFPEVINSNLNLPTNFDYNVTGTWKSNNPDIVTDAGVIMLTNEENNFSITLILKSGELIMEKTFNLKTAKIAAGEIHFNSHHYLAYAQDFDTAKFSNLEIEADRLVLSKNQIFGSYESPVFKTSNFSILVGSWAAISNKTTTAELKVRVRVNGVWSNYLSYGAFGLGLQNKMFNQDGEVAELKDDEVKIKDSKTADAFQYQIILQRDQASVESAKLSLVSMALLIPDYTFNVDISNLPKKVEYDLPNLYQHDVPVIGDSICSITSSTMLLMYHGHTFSDSLPHRENALLFKEYNSGIYGNWVYNTVGMSAYGENSYVKRIYSIEELFYILATIGPVALSIKGATGRYTTNGHLIVVSGYEITETGRKILVHDPNLSEVEWEFSEAIYNGFTRNILYVVEKNS